MGGFENVRVALILAQDSRTHYLSRPRDGNNTNGLVSSIAVDEPRH